MATPSFSQTRYRCTACGNLTRFEVTTTRKTRAFHHFDLGGDLRIEDEEVLAENVDEVLCRWCGTGSSVVVVEETDSQPSAVDEAGSRVDRG